MVELLSEGWLVAGFYLLLIALIYLNRHRFEFEGKIIALLRTNTGVDWMNKYGAKHPRLVKTIASIGVVVGYLGMFAIVAVLFNGLYDLFTDPRAPPVISPVLPGVPIPGSPIQVPLFEGLLALFVVIVVHEAAHGLVAAAYKVKVKTSGLVLFGPIPGAFVEPDEKELPKQTPWAQLSVFAAGPWSNVLLAILVFGLLLGFQSATTPLLNIEGVAFQQTQPESPAAIAGLEVNTTYTQLNGQELSSANDISRAINGLDPGDEITIIQESGESTTLELGAYSADENACIGIERIYVERGEDFYTQNPIIAWFLQLFEGVLMWIVLLSLGLGLANLLPLGPVDGGRMLLMALQQKFEEKTAKKIWGTISFAILALVLILLFVPIIRAWLFPLEPLINQCLPI